MGGTHTTALSSSAKHVSTQHPILLQVLRRLLDLAKGEKERLALFESAIPMVHHSSYPAKQVSRALPLNTIMYT